MKFCNVIGLESQRIMLRSLAFAGVVVVQACAPHVPPTDDSVILTQYNRFAETAPQILPQDYIAYLRATKFTHGELDSLPRDAIILHDARVLATLAKLGYDSTQIRTLALGTTDPSVLYVLPPHEGIPAALVNGGLPGGGGISTQAAELSALGVLRVVHVGTAGLLGTCCQSPELIVSRGAVKDGSAVLLDDQQHSESIARPDSTLAAQLAEVLASQQVAYTQQYGLTIPIFYYQPSGFVIWAMTNSVLPEAQRPQYIEMEDATLFATARRTHVKAASIVIPTDRYVLTGAHLYHTYVNDDADKLEAAAVAACLYLFRTRPL